MPSKAPIENIYSSLTLSPIIPKRGRNIKQKLRIVNNCQEEMGKLFVLSCSAPNEVRVKGDAMTQEKPN